MFKIIDKDGSNTVSKDEFMAAMYDLIGKPPVEKLNLLFQIYDLDGKLIREAPVILSGSV